MMRTTLVEEKGLLQSIATGTGVFKPHEIEALGEVLDDYHAVSYKHGHRAITFEQDGAVIGFAYFAPTPMTDRTWHLYWIFVDKNTHARGIGTQMLQYAEREILKAGGRLFLIETSSLPGYEPTRAFYRKHGYDQAAIILDFYADGDDQVIFRKRLA